MVATNIDFEKFSRRASFFVVHELLTVMRLTYDALKQNVKRILN
mgnify:CR=1 FL=1